MPVKRFIPRVKEAIQQMFQEQEDVWPMMGDALARIITRRLTEIKNFIDTRYRRPANVYSVTKKLIQKEAAKVDNTMAYKLAVEILRETPSEKRQSEEKAKQALEARNDTVTKFNLEYVLQAITTLSSDPYNDPEGIFVALQVASGCRQRDLFDPSLVEFTDAFDGCVIQKGSSKSRKPFVIKKTLTGMSTKRFLFLLDWFHGYLYNQLPDKSVTQRVQLWNRRLCKRTKQFFPVDQKRSGTHVNRALHAALVRIMKGNKKSAPRAVQTELGHSGMSSSLHYLYVDVCEEGGLAPMKEFLLKLPVTAGSLFLR